MDYKKTFINGCLVLLAALTTSGCSSLLDKAGGKFPPDSLASVGNNKIIVVGKMELFPPLQHGEQMVYSNAERAFVNKAFVVTDDKLHDVKLISPSWISIRHAAQVELGQTFFYEENFTNVLLYSGSFVQMTYRSENTAYSESTIYEGKLILPGGYKFNLTPGDKAVYIGTFQYYRDASNNITKVKLKDEYTQANEEFRKKYGASVDLKNPKPVKF